MPTARHGLGAAAVVGRIYVISGGPTPGDSVSAANEIFGFANIESFKPGTNMQAWLFTILRNEFYSECRRRRRRLGSINGNIDGLASKPTQEDFEEDPIAPLLWLETDS